MSQPHPRDPTIIISLGNCGTSERTFFGTLDNCIVIQYDSNDKKVSLKFLKNNKVEVRFFKSINSKKYTSNRLLNSFPNICDNKNISLLCIVNYLTSKYELTSTGEVISLNSPPDTTTPKYTSLLRWTNKLVTDMDIFFNKNPKLQHWRNMLRPYIEIYNSLQIRQIHNTNSPSIHSHVPSLPSTKVADINSLSLLSSSSSSETGLPKSPTSVAAVKPLPLLSSSSSETGSHKDTIQTASSSVAAVNPLPSLSSSSSETGLPKSPTSVEAVKPLPSLSSSSSSETGPPKATIQPESSNDMAGSPYLHRGETKNYVTLFHTNGKIYFKKNPNGSIDFSKIYTSPPTGGSNKRYRTTRRSRKYQSRRKSRRHIRKRIRTHRHKSRKSRK